jgi:hypothetical protein
MSQIITVTVNTLSEKDLEKKVQETGLELADGKDAMTAFLPFAAQLSEIAEQAKTINTVEPTKDDEKLARELRLKTVKIRTGAERVKEQRKRVHLLRGNIEQSFYNIIKDNCSLAETGLEQIEKYSEEQERIRKEALREVRLKELREFTDQADIYPLAEMTEESYQDLLGAMKIQKEEKEKARIAEEQRLEQERIAAEQELLRKEIHKNRYVQLLRDYKYAHEGDLGALTDDEFFAIEKVAREEHEARIADEKAKEKELAEAKRKADEAAAEAKAAQDALRAKEEAEQKALKEKADAEKKALAETIAQAKKAAKAPDKVKLSSWINGLECVGPELKTDEGIVVRADIQAKFEGFKKWAISEIEKL